MKAIWVTLSGPDHPGITAELTALLTAHQSALLEIEQVVVSGQLILSFAVADTKKQPKLLSELLSLSEDRGLTLAFKTILLAQSKTPIKTRKLIATLIGNPITPEALHLFSSIAAKRAANIESIRRLSDDTFSSLEIELSFQGDKKHLFELKEELLETLSQKNIDFALQREHLHRRSKRLVVMDLDSTLIQAEVINELARVHGVYDAVAEITKKAMHEGLDFKKSLAERMALLKGLDIAVMKDVLAKIELQEGAVELVSVLKDLGFKVAIISGGFLRAANHFKEKLGLDYAFANELEVKEGKLTGLLIGDIVDAKRKAELLAEIAQKEGISISQTIAIGDGMNDAHMLAAAGLGIAYKSKHALKKAADTSLSQGGLLSILYFLGIRQKDLKTT